MQQHRRRNTHRDSHSNRIALGVVGAVVLLGAAVALYVAFRPNANATSSVSRQPQAPVSVAAGAEPTVAPAPKPLATPVRKPATKPATKVAVAAAPTPAPTLPEQMKRMLPGSTQIIVVTGAKLGSNTGTVYVFNKQGAHWVEKLRTATRMGTNGLINGAARHTNTLTTPTGIWKIGAFVFGKDARPPAGTLMPYRQITDGSWWSEEPNSTYNTWVESARPIQGEHLLGAASQQYEFALDAAYNELPNERVIGRGTAIFLHVLDPPSYHNGFSAGCVGIPRSDMIRVFKLIDPKRNPSFSIGTLERATPTSIYAY